MMENSYLNPNFVGQITSLGGKLMDTYLDKDPLGLTIYQRMALPVIRWLFFGQIASGRTFLMAHMFIQRAIETSDWVHYFDHIYDFKHEEHMRMVIISIVELSYSRYKLEVSLAKRAIRRYLEMKNRLSILLLLALLLYLLTASTTKSFHLLGVLIANRNFPCIDKSFLT